MMRPVRPEAATGTEPRSKTQVLQWWLLGLGQCVLALGLLQQWLNVGTYRLFVDEGAGPAQARQRFDLRDGRVEPQILITEDSRLSFPLDSASALASSVSASCP